MASQSLSLSFPQRSRAEPVKRFHLPSIWSQFTFSPSFGTAGITYLGHVCRRLNSEKFMGPGRSEPPIRPLPSTKYAFQETNSAPTHAIALVTAADGTDDETRAETKVATGGGTLLKANWPSACLSNCDLEGEHYYAICSTDQYRCPIFAFRHDCPCVRAARKGERKAGQAGKAGGTTAATAAAARPTG